MMIVFPHAKINLGLRITGKRPDGYHSIETIFLPVTWHDILEFVPAGEGASAVLTVSGEETGVTAEENLVYKAWKVLSAVMPLPALHIHLHKTIPPGSGMGGGSSDAAYLLRALACHFKTILTSEELIRISLGLGSDCPFFMQDRPCLATGRGEVLTAVGIDLRPYELFVVVPGIRISTSWAYGQVSPSCSGTSLRELVCQPVEAWKGKIINDFEKVVIGSHPEIGEIRGRLYTLGAVYASMSGSGSSVYGIFRKGTAPVKDDFPGMHSWKGSIFKAEG